MAPLEVRESRSPCARIRATRARRTSDVRKAPIDFGLEHLVFDIYAYVKHECALITAMSAAAAH
jgi:hypothetical protein